ncbi:TPA: DNA-directed RNA polymerase subunit beta [Candidatus Nomurabacteria bacterium]|nr:MAG: DNA-directed RNA polymerase subunit beta [Parcubacteria bacterium RAAC4_OD1_1]HCY26576.1 DNA-directed RNA polymerase subunit beta [Candidatus Nomurabacteria bacterium]
MKKIVTREKKYFSRYKKPLSPFPNLIENQIVSFNWLVESGFKEVFKEFSPINDYSDKKFQLEFTSFVLSEPKFSEEYTKVNKLTYEGSLKARIKLFNKTIGVSKEQEVFMADIPLMTKHGTFIINGVERVIVPQLTRSFGVFFTEQDLKGKNYFGAKIIPARGVWIEIDSDPDGNVYVRVDKKRKFHVTALLRVLGYETDESILKAFSKDEASLEMIKMCLEKDPAKNKEDAYIEIYKRLRDGDLATSENAREFINILFSSERYDISPVGRFRFNKRFDKSMDEKEIERRTIDASDVASIISHIISLNNDPHSKGDDIDHLGQRRVRYVGEMLQQKFRMGMAQIKRNIQDRMSTIDVSTTMPIQVINQRPLQARIKEFFTANQLSQFMNQENVLAEVEHLRTLSALGPGGLTRERAGLEVRDVHTSHYGRVCPIHTPEGPNIGLILHLSTYAKINEFGIIETPYVKVKNGKITGEIVYLNALEEEKYNIAHSGISYDEDGNIKEEKVEARLKTKPGIVSKKEIDYIDVATNQAFSIATSMIPFLEHDDAHRTLMGSNMQKQALPCILPEAPLVATGIEELASRDSGRLIISEVSGIISYVDAKKISVKDDKGKDHTYPLVSFSRTNNFSILHQRPIVSLGDKIKKGDILADTSTTDNGQIALGQNALVAFMSWAGANYEDAIILSERLVKNSKFTSIYITEFICNVRDTKLGPEITTRDIPNVGENKLKDLDEDGIIIVGAEVTENDILVGKITPKGETELTPEERLLRSIFTEKARDVKDTSMRLEHGKKGRVVGVKIFSRDQGHNLESGIIKRIVVEVAQLRNISVGDKLAGRHGNKGVISTILPEEEMPFMADGTPIDIILTPLGVPSRMNLGQILEMHLGYAANALGYQAIVPPFSGASVSEIKEELVKSGLPESGKVTLYDGRTGDAFDQDIAIGYMYMLKLHHMVEDKIHMRSIGPYSLITQQPLGGKAQGGGQRFGEMEVWALEGHGASHTLREMLTIKSDDIVGRSETFDSIIKGLPIGEPNLPASFNVMLNYLRGLSLDVELKRLDNN